VCQDGEKIEACKNEFSILKMNGFLLLLTPLEVLE